MKQDWANKWIAALRSGEYVQGRNHLNYDNSKLCCLGVLCEIWRQEQVIPIKWEYAYSATNRKSILGMENSIPQEIMQETGMHDGEGRFHLIASREIRLSMLNDHEKLSFNQLADVIAYFWKKL